MRECLGGKALVVATYALCGFAKLFVDCHPNWRHRQHCPRTASEPVASRTVGLSCRHLRLHDDGHDCWDAGELLAYMKIEKPIFAL